MARKKLTTLLVTRTKPPAPGPGGAVTRAEIWDTLLPAFGLRISSTGRKTYCVMYRVRGEQVRQNIGDAAVIDLDEAREKARDALKAVQAGTDPRLARDALREREKDTVAAV